MEITTKAVFQMRDDGDGGIAFDELERESYEYEGPVAEAKGGGGSSTTNTVAKPWKGVQPHLRSIYAEGKELSNQPFEFYPGQTYIPQNYQQRRGAAEAFRYGRTGGGGLLGDITEAQRSMLSAPSLDANPYAQEYANALTRRIGQDLSENVMPAIRSNAISSGQMGSSRQGIAEGLAASRALDTMADARAGLMNEMYGQGLEQQARGMAFTPQTMQMGLMPAQAMSQYGDYLSGEKSRALQEAIDRFNFAQQEPWNRLERFNALLQGGTKYGSTSTSTSGGGLGGALGGGLTGMSLASGLSSPMGAGLFGGTPTLAGLGTAGTMGLYGLGGALLGGLFR